MPNTIGDRKKVNSASVLPAERPQVPRLHLLELAVDELLIFLGAYAALDLVSGFLKALLFVAAQLRPPGSLPRSRRCAGCCAGRSGAFTMSVTSPWCRTMISAAVRF